ncbi:uncharacterized protein EAE98_009841 [Botrytis deweyae]|uniref:BZIP domain-containing protein n=1 Tax=Botrytis deweyae TaxID=2478750 RepID=A0ABQ7IAD3_9HELO|nr:uncharacterized protein EAE98_009841 [Botrytis deweyae]KAF7918229.1 hypothetical protein EAE98_009841 [Botrytis deweyae]
MEQNLIPLQLMPHQNGMLSFEEDWTGITDKRRRKKMQDRLNQRITRKRKLLKSKVQKKEGRSQLHHGDSDLIPTPLARQFHFSHGDHQAPELYRTTAQQTNPQRILPHTNSTDIEDIDSIQACRPDSRETQSFLLHFSTRAYHNYLHLSPSSDNSMMLIQFNTTRAFIANAQTLGLTTSSMARTACSRFFVDLTAGNTSFTLDLFSLPLSLHPTPLQREIPHHPWIDLLPIPQLRDNLLRRNNQFDEVELCREMRGVKSAKLGRRNGIIVWRDPWDESGWEVTETFARNWAWVIGGCEGLFRSTDHWRSLRGEKPLFLRTRNTREKYCRVTEEVS